MHKWNPQMEFVISLLSSLDSILSMVETTPTKTKTKMK
jgi:hypothetical protein